MRKFFCILLLAVNISAYAQAGVGHGVNDSVTQDPLKTQTSSVQDNLTKPEQIANKQQQETDRNINAISELQKERRAKQKKDAIIRIGIGVALLVVLVIGLNRKRRTR